MSQPPRRTRVLVVDDSTAARLLLSKAIAADERFEIVGTLGSAEEVLEKIDSIAPDVMTLDIEMPGLSGIELLHKLRPVRPTPTVIVSAYSARGAKLTLEALDAGAVDVVEKPSAAVPPQAMFAELRTKLAIAATARVTRVKRPDAVPRSAANVVPGRGMGLIAIGASTGGPQAVQALIAALPANAPPVIVVIHMPGGFTRTYAQRLNDLARVSVEEAQEGDELVSGRVLVAPGGRQLRVKRRGSSYFVELGDTERVGGHAPSVDVLFESVAQAAGSQAVGAIMTGMGSDGAQGLLALRKAGGRTFAQDEASCVVFGMPRAAWELGAAEGLVSLDDLASRLTSVQPLRSAERA